MNEPKIVLHIEITHTFSLMMAQALYRLVLAVETGEYFEQFTCPEHGPNCPDKDEIIARVRKEARKLERLGDCLHVAGERAMVGQWSGDIEFGGKLQ